METFFGTYLNESSTSLLLFSLFLVWVSVSCFGIFFPPLFCSESLTILLLNKRHLKSFSCSCYVILHEERKKNPLVIRFIIDSNFFSIQLLFQFFRLSLPPGRWEPAIFKILEIYSNMKYIKNEDGNNRSVECIVLHFVSTQKL